MKKSIFNSILLFSLILISFSCNNDPEIVVPLVSMKTTNQNVEVTYTTIKISGEVTGDGGSKVSGRGVCWSTFPNPTIDNDKTNEISDTFTSEIEDLISNTTYYFRVYATNSIGTSYSDEQAFDTSTLEATTWDFFIVHSSTISWHADVTFKADGSTFYDEPDYPGLYSAIGTWSLDGNTLTYILDPAISPNYQFTGTLDKNTISGTYTFQNEDKTWTATKY